MKTTKIMKNFNVEKYNEKMAELDNAIKIVNEYIREYRTWYPDESITPQFIQQLFTFPTKIFNKLVQFALQSRIRTSGTGSVELPNSIQYYQLRITCLLYTSETRVVLLKRVNYRLEVYLKSNLPN